MIVVVGGHSRNIGKTSVAAAVIRAFPEARWTAVKITQHGHGICSEAGKSCGCGDVAEHPFALDRETQPGATDSGRFLAAGAERAYWLRTAQSELAYGMPALRELVATSENVILESNSVLGFLRPSLYLAVLNYAVADFKDSAQRFLDRADAFVVVDAGAHGPRWGNIPWRRIESKPRFAVQPPDYFSEQLRAFLLPYVAAVVSAKPA